MATLRDEEEATRFEGFVDKKGLCPRTLLSF
jgi:hypothetical protein